MYVRTCMYVCLQCACRVRSVLTLARTRVFVLMMPTLRERFWDALPSPLKAIEGDEGGGRPDGGLTVGVCMSRALLGVMYTYGRTSMHMHAYTHTRARSYMRVYTRTYMHTGACTHIHLHWRGRRSRRAHPGLLPPRGSPQPCGGPPPRRAPRRGGARGLVRDGDGGTF